MRKFTATATLIAILATAAPLTARPKTREDRPRDVESPIVRKVKQVVKRVFGGITILETPTLPIPD